MPTTIMLPLTLNLFWTQTLCTLHEWLNILSITIIACFDNVTVFHIVSLTHSGDTSFDHKPHPDPALISAVR